MAEVPIMQLSNISLPVLDTDGKIIGTLQVESMYKLRKLGKATANQQTQIDKGVVKKKEYYGFSMIDEQVMIILATLARLKID